MRFIYYIIFILCIFSNIYSFGGKPIAVDNVELYYTTPTSVVVDVYMFKNDSKDKNYDYLSYTIPDLIASQIKYNKTLLVDEKNITFTPVNMERIYENKILEVSNVRYSVKFLDTNTNSKVSIITNLEVVRYTNWGAMKTNVKVISPETTNIKINKTNEMIYNYNGTNILVRGITNFNLPVSLGEGYILYEGSDIEKYAFARNADFAIYGTIKTTRRTVIVETFIAEIKSKKVVSYVVEISNEFVDDGINRYSFGLANQINSMPKTGLIGIKTSPPNALVYVDDLYIGKSTGLLYMNSLTTNSHKFSIRNEFYKPLDMILSFEESEKEDIYLEFNLTKYTDVGKVAISLMDRTNSQVIINGIKEPVTNYIEKTLPFGTHALKILDNNYKDYYAMFNISSTNTLNIIPNMVLKREPTLADRIFKNYERNTKIALGLTIAGTIFSFGAYIYANEVFDSEITKYDKLYRDDNNRPPINLSGYNNAMKAYWVGLGVSAAFALTAGIYYMLWIGEDDFKVEEIGFNTSNGGIALSYTLRF